MKNFDLILSRHLNEFWWFAFKYEVLNYCFFKSDSKKIYLGDKSDRYCRYCGCVDRKKFRLEAHAFPELIGNHYLIDYNECDECNENFSRSYEDDFGKWSAPWRTMERVSGKKGIPKYKSNDGEIEVRPTDSKNIKIFTKDAESKFLEDEQGKYVQLEFTRQPYIPHGVYKCLVKMAFVMFPDKLENEINFIRKYLINWDGSEYLLKPVQIMHRFASGPLPNDRFRVFLLKRINKISKIPYMQFVLQMGNHSFQIILPLSDNVVVEKKSLNVNWENRYFPMFHVTPMHQNTYGGISSKYYDMTNNSKIKEDIVYSRFSYDELIEQPHMVGMDVEELKK